MKKTVNKTTKNNFITYGMVIAIFAVVQILSSTGNLSRLLTGLLVPICVYTIASLSLNLVVGYSGELSLGHAGFMCVGAYSSAVFSHVTSDLIPSVPRLILAILVGAVVAAVFGVLIGIPVLTGNLSRQKIASPSPESGSWLFEPWLRRIYGMPVTSDLRSRQKTTLLHMAW